VTNWPSSNGRGGYFSTKVAQHKGIAMSTSIKNSESRPEKNQPVSEETLLKIAKEIAIKFIEMGRLTPATFDQAFKDIHTTVKETAKNT
jgi:hypothetical protein